MKYWGYLCYERVSHRYRKLKFMSDKIFNIKEYVFIIDHKLIYLNGCLVRERKD